MTVHKKNFIDADYLETLSMALLRLCDGVIRITDAGHLPICIVNNIIRPHKRRQYGLPFMYVVGRCVVFHDRHPA